MPYSIGHGDPTEFECHVESFACTECGHIEMYAEQDRLDRIIGRLEQQKRAAMIDNEINAQIIAKENELEELKRIVDDENQTVKSVREAKEKMINVQDQINSLKNQKNQRPISTGGACTIISQ